MKPSEIYDELITIGKIGILEYEPKLAALFPRKGSNAWKLYENSLAQNYNSKDLINLFRGLVICEKELKWHCGSTTPAAHLYQDIKSLGLDQDNSLADWAFQYSDNEYIPFGFIRHGEKTAYEYIEWREDFHNRLIQEKLDKEERKKKKLERANLITEEKKRRDDVNKKYYQEIMRLPVKEQIDIILKDDKHIIYFYMPVIYNLLDSDNVEKDDLLKLSFKFGERKMTPFNKRICKLLHYKIITIMYGPRRFNTPETLE